jgi:hypothetical protein
MQNVAFAIHTSMELVTPVGSLFREILPEVRLVNLVDDSLLVDVRMAGHVTPCVSHRIVGYGMLSAIGWCGCDLNCCSSAGEAADLLRQMVKILVVKIDQRMAESAGCCSPRIAVIATTTTTPDPTVRLLERLGASQGRSIAIRRYLVEGAFDVRMSGDGDKHDRMMLAEIERAAAENDVVVRAQGSIARLVPALQGKVQIPVLSNPRLGVEALRKALQA